MDSDAGAVIPDDVILFDAVPDDLMRRRIVPCVAVVIGVGGAVISGEDDRASPLRGGGAHAMRHACAEHDREGGEGHDDGSVAVHACIIAYPPPPVKEESARIM